MVSEARQCINFFTLGPAYTFLNSPLVWCCGLLIWQQHTQMISA